MKPIKHFLRLIKINHVLAKNGLDELIVSHRAMVLFRFMPYLNPWNWFRKTQYNRAVALRKSFEELGPIFVKFGQALSTRPDIVPEDIAEELEKLQDRVKPFSSEIALELIEKAYGKPALEIFHEFDEIPLASASMAQVHAAILKNNKAVVVKILRPNMRKIIENDIGLMFTIAQILEDYWPEAKRFKPKEIVQEFQQHLIDEMDLQREAANAGQLRRNFTNSPLLYVPEVYWEYAKSNIMVAERIYGTPINDIETLKALDVNLKMVAERGVEIFFTQVFRDSFFHADMHPGNIFIDNKNPKDARYICVDFGIIGTLNDNDRHYLAENLLAFFNRDYYRVAQLHVESGWVSRKTRIGDFEAAIRTVCEPIFERPLKQISFGQIILKLFQVARRFDMEVQPQLVLLQKTLLAIEGLGRKLDPDLDLWATAKPFLEKWIKQQAGPQAFFKEMQKNIPFITEQLPNLPKLMFDYYTLAKEREMQTIEHLKQPIIPSKSLNIYNLGLGISLGFLFTTLVLRYKVLPMGAFTSNLWIGGAVLASLLLGLKALRRT
jgi:ubiquinone biosynthesis protein